MNKFRFFAVIAATVLLTVFLCAPLSASTIPQPSDCFYVYDEADIISEETEEYIIAQNDKLFYSTGSQIVFVAMKNIGDTHIRDYSKKLFTEWSIGDTERQNGVLVLITTENENYWVLQGIGIDDDLTSAKLKSMTDNYLEPYFLSKDYDKGIKILFDNLTAAVADIYDEDLSKVVLPEGGIDPNGNPKGASGSSIGSVVITIFIVIVIIAIIAVIGLMIYRNLSESRYRRKNYKPSVRLAPDAGRLPSGRPPRQNVTAPRQNMNVPRQNMNVPRQNMNVPRQNMNVPRQNMNVPRQNVNVPRQNVNVPRQNMNVPRQNMNVPRQNMNVPRQNVNVPRQNMNAPRQNMNVPRQNMNVPRQNMNVPRQNMNAPRQNADTRNGQR